MTEESVIHDLESEWEAEHGFFWKIRQGSFSEEEFQRAFRRVSAIGNFEGPRVDRRVVSLLWYIPLFMHWQTERIAGAGGDVDAYEKAVNAMTNQVERLLGIP